MPNYMGVQIYAWSSSLHLESGVEQIHSKVTK